MKFTLYFLVILSLIGLMLARPSDDTSDADDDTPDRVEPPAKKAEKTAAKAAKQTEGDAKGKAIESANNKRSENAGSKNPMADIMAIPGALLGSGAKVFKGAMDGFESGMNSAMKF